MNFLTKIKAIFPLMLALCLLLTVLSGCKKNDLQGNPAYDRLNTKEAQELYEELLNDIKEGYYEVTIDANDSQQLLEACAALVSDMSESLDIPVEIKTINEKELLNGTRYTLRIIYSEQP